MQYQQSGLDKLRIKLRGTELQVISLVLLIWAIVIGLKRNEFTQLAKQYEEFGQFVILAIIVSFVMVWAVLRLITMSVRKQFWSQPWVVFALFDQGKFVSLGKGFVIRGRQEAIHFLMPRDWPPETKRTTGGRSIVLKAKGLPLKLFFKVTLHFSEVDWQSIYDICRKSEAFSRMTQLPFARSATAFDFGAVLGNALEKVLQTQQAVLQTVLDEHIATDHGAGIDALYRKLADCLDTGTLRFPGVDKVEVGILRED